MPRKRKRLYQHRKLNARPKTPGSFDLRQKNRNHSLDLSSCVEKFNDLLARDFSADSLGQRSSKGLSFLCHRSGGITVDDLDQSCAELFSLNSGSCVAGAPDADFEVLDSGRKVVGVNPNGEDDLRDTGTVTKLVLERR